MTLRRWLLALGAFFSLAVAIAGCGSDVPGGAVASVAGTPITTRAFNHWMYVIAKGQSQSSPGVPLVVPTDPPKFKSCVTEIRTGVPTLAKESSKQLRATCMQLFKSLSGQVLNFLIPSYWYQADAAKHHVKVTASQVQQAFAKDKTERFGSSAQGFQSYLSQSGQTMQDVLYNVRVNLIYQKLIQRATKPVTDAAISAYYSAHSSQFGTPESRDLRIVLTKTKSSADQAKAALQHGQSWTTVAKRYSIDTTTKDKGGRLTNITQGGGEDQTLTKAAFAAPRNKLEGPLSSQFGYYVFEVTKITPATHESLAKARPQIKQTLTLAARQRAQTMVDARARKEYLSQTNCLGAYMMADCHGYKPPKGGTGPTTGGVGG
jgi:foldase protein PrsA